MGRPKALLPWGSATLIEHVYESIAAACDDIVIVTGPRQQYIELFRERAQVVADIVPHKGPLGGLHTGLTHAHHEYSLVVGCDMPFLKSAVIQLLTKVADGSPIVALGLSGQTLSMPALYHKCCLQLIGHLIMGPDLSLRRLILLTSAKVIPLERWRKLDPDMLCVRSLNTMQQWRRAMETAKVDDRCPS